MSPAVDALCGQIGRKGFCFVAATAASLRFGGNDAIADWDAFVTSWNDMPRDPYMADGGRYRRRRHATFTVAPFATLATREAPQPHYQSRDYNTLNGGIARQYQPIAGTIVRGPIRWT